MLSYPINRWICLLINLFHAFDVDSLLISKLQYPCQIRVGVCVCELRVHCYVVCFWHRACVFWIFLSIPFQCCQYKCHYLFYILLRNNLCCSAISIILLFSFLSVMYIFEGLVTTGQVTRFSAWATWCRYFRSLLVICFLDIYSNNVASDGLHFTECNYWFLYEFFFKVDVLSNTLMIFFLKYFG